MSAPIRVLVVEDEEIAAAAHAEYVRRVDGFELAAVARTGSEALSLLGLSQQRHGPHVPVDLVLLDMNLPDYHGLDILRRIRGAGLPVGIIAVTAVRELPMVRKAIASGVAQYLIKPFTFAAFSDKLHHYRQFRESLAQHGQATTQAAVDMALAALRTPGPATVPKGLSEDTLENVIGLLRDGGSPVSAVEVGERLGMSRVTARRYLEHLAEQNTVSRTPRYGTRGRPEFEYRWRQ
ncbi:response regulator [Arthrobacter sp. GCM10027362]|uniref:response regulator n=1 Tax=Arthrobacter sp. GCM10027362 TaxID=3273379 RepID=UPI0036254A64